MVMEAQTNGPLKGMPNGAAINGLNVNGLNVNGLNVKDLSINCPTINCSEPSDSTNQHKNPNGLSKSGSSSSISSTSVSSPSASQPCHSPQPLQSPVFFQTSPPAGVTSSVPYYLSLSSPRSPISSGDMASYSQAPPFHVHTSHASPHHGYTSQATPQHGYTSQASAHHGYTSQASPHHVYTSQHSMLGTHHCNSAGKGWYPSNTIIINPAGSAPGQGGGGGGRITPVGCATPGRITPGRITPGRGTPVYAVAMKKRYVDIMLASTASTVAIDNKIEQAMDLVKSHLMFAVREEVDVLKERIGELMERINHLEYENTVLRKYATQEALQQIQQQHGGAPNP